MTNLTQASHELFSRPADERFQNLAELATHCHNLKERSRRLKEPSIAFLPEVHDGHMTLRINGYPPFGLNDWSFSQLCSIAKVTKDTVIGGETFAPGFFVWNSEVGRRPVTSTNFKMSPIISMCRSPTCRN
jgi:hypothetical protein